MAESELPWIFAVPLETVNIPYIQKILQLMEVDRPFIEEHVDRLVLHEQWLVCQPRGH